MAVGNTADGANLESLLAQTKAAQKAYAEFPQTQVDAIFKAAALAADKAAITLAKAAVAETGMGNVEDKVIKNRYASEYIYTQYKDTPTVGVVSRDSKKGLAVIAEPLGVLAAVIPCTNPTSTAVFQALLALKTRNGIVFSPHPRAAKSTIAALEVVSQAAVAAGAPAGIVNWISAPSIELSVALMKACDCTLATGGPGMVFSAYSAGKPAIGVGPGNVPVVIDASADIDAAASAIIHSKSFDNGVVCASEQNAIAVREIYERFKAALAKHGAYFIPAADMDKVRAVLMRHSPKDPAVMSANPLVVGQTPVAIGKLAGIEVPANARILVGEIPSFDYGDPFAHEKLAPVLSLIKADDFAQAVAIAETVVEHGGHGHTASLFADPDEHSRIDRFADVLETCRILVNTPSSQGGIGGIYNALRPSLTLGCGSWGGNSTWENVGPDNLLNYKTVAIGGAVRDPVFLTPGDLFVGKDVLKDGLNAALKPLRDRRVVIVEDAVGHPAEAEVLARLGKLKAKTVIVNVVAATKPVALKAVKSIHDAKAGLVLALGGDLAVSVAKLARLLAADRKADLAALALPFLSEAKRIATLPTAVLPLAVVQTTAWAREGVSQGLFYSDRAGIHRIFDSSLVPRVAILDKDLIAPVSVSDSEKAFAALARAVSAFTSVTAGPAVDKISLLALRAAQRLFAKGFGKGKAIELGLWSALAFSNTIGGFSDALSRALSETFAVSQESALSVILPSAIVQIATDAPYKMGTGASYLVPSGKAKIALAAQKLGLAGHSEDESAAAFRTWIGDIRIKQHLPTALADLGITPAALKKGLDETAELAFGSQAVLSSPSYPRIEGIKNLLRSLS